MKKRMNIPPNAGVIRNENEHIRLRMLHARSQPQPSTESLASPLDSQIPIMELNIIQKPTR